MQEQNFKKAVGDLKDMKIGLVLGDNQLIEGILLDVKEDHLVVHVNQNVFYFALQHIQALSRNAKDFRMSPEIVPYLNKNDLVDVLRAFRYTWVTINSLNNREITGVLSRISEDHIMLINNAEQLYIPKSYISNIYSTIAEEDIIFINNQEQSATQNSTISKDILEANERHVTSEQEKAIKESDPYSADKIQEQSDSSLEEKLLAASQAEQVAIEHIKTTNNSELEKNIEAPIIEKFTGEILEVEDEKNEYVQIGQEKSIQDFISLVNDKSKEWLDLSLEKDLQEILCDEQAVVEHMQLVNNSEIEKNVEVSIVEESVEELEIVTNARKELLEVYSKADVTGESNYLQFDELDLLNSEEQYALEMDYEDVLESAKSASSEEQLILTEPQPRRKKKRILITEWSTIKEEQQAMPDQRNSAEESDLPIHDGESIEMEKDEEFCILDEKSEPIETISIDPFKKKISLKEEKAMLEKQYYALMKHAEESSIRMEHRAEYDQSIQVKNTELEGKNNVHIIEGQISSQEERTMLEKQYVALMKHAEKMYQQFRD